MGFMNDRRVDSYQVLVIEPVTYDIIQQGTGLIARSLLSPCTSLYFLVLRIQLGVQQLQQIQRDTELDLIPNQLE